MSHITIYRWAIVSDLYLMLKKHQEFLFFSPVFSKKGGKKLQPHSFTARNVCGAQSSLLYDITIVINKY